MQIAILAGGKATRLYPLTKVIPKSMVKLYGKPFLTYQIELLRKNNVNDIILCVGTFSKQIIDYFGNGKNFGVSIKYSVEKSDKLLGTAGALKQAQEYLEKKFFVMYGDSYLPINFNDVFSKFTKSKKLGLMTIYENNNKFDKSNVAVHDNVITFYDKSGKNKSLRYIDYGLLVLNKQTLELIPSNEFVNLDFLIDALIEKNELYSYEVKNRFYEIGSLSGIKDFKNYIKSK